MEPDYAAWAQQFNPAQDTLDATRAMAATRAIQAQRTAGQQIAGGDSMGGANTLYGAGDIRGGQDVQTFGGNVAGSKALAANDFQGAKTGFGQAGDAKGVMSAQDAAVQRFQTLHSYIRLATPVFAAAYQQAGTDGLLHAIDTVGEDLKNPAIGMTDQQIQQYRQQAATNPQSFLSTVNSLAAQQLKWEKVGDDVIGIDSLTGQPITRITGSKQQTLKTPAGGEELAVVPGQVSSLTGTPPADASAPSYGGPQTVAKALGGVTDPNVDMNALAKTAMLESGGNPEAKNASGASGLYQFMPKTAQGFGLNDPTDPQAAAQAAAAYQLTSQKALTSILGRPAEGAELYLAHMQGPAGAAALLSHPESKAIDVLAPLYGNRQQATAAIVQNGGTPDMKAGDFTGLWQKRYDAAPNPLETAQPQARTTNGVQIVASTDTGQKRVRNATPAELLGTGFVKGQVDSATGKIENGVKPGDVDNWTDADVSAAAEQYRLTGQIPTTVRGQGAEAAVQRIQTRARELDQEQGVSPGQRASIQATVKTAQGALEEVTKQEAMIGAYERTANANADRVLSLLDKGGTNMPTTHLAWASTLARHVFNDTDLAALDGAIKDFSGEFSKVIAGSGTGSGTGGGVGEREGNADFFSSSNPIPVLKARIAQAKAGMAQRTSELASERTRLANVIQTGEFAPQKEAAASSPPVAAPSTSYRLYDANGKRTQ